ncbi:calmodulin-2/4-like [Haliotis rufescens]|uniref:calmodulin-2/4-like n=1 Tax=Haliotis rufescens TaxID=6454 RepID=UPI001EB09EAD|nr:calmodulin-2/4-like [Haliotis rufescens]
MSLKKEKRDELQEAFIMNQGSDQRLPLRMLGVVVRSIGCSPCEADLNKIEKDLSGRGVTSLDYNQVEQIVSTNSWVPESLETLKEAFATFDREGNGFIPAQDLRYVLTHMGEKLRDEDVDEMIREVDLTGDGQVNFEGLSKSLLSYI